MDGRFNSNPFVSEQEEQENSPENSGDSPPSPMFNDAKISSSTSSPKRRFVSPPNYTYCFVFFAWITEIPCKKHSLIRIGYGVCFSRRAMQKRVVSVPIKDVEGSRVKGDCAPPSDSWAWRKYGQKPIKGSPYPR